MTKLNMNPDFDDGGEAQGSSKKVMVDEELLGDEGDEEEKETEDDESEEEGDQSDASTDKEPGAAVGDEGADAKAIAEKKRELAGLDKEDEKLDSDLISIEEQIRARKESIVAKRKDRREARRSQQDSPPEKDEDVDLSGIEPEDIANMEKVLRKKGYAPMAELEALQLKNAAETAENTLFEKYPQYRPENDKDDVLFNALQRELNDFANPKTPAQIARILEKAHGQVVTQFPSRFPKRSSKAEADTARRTKMNLAGTGTGNSGLSTSKSKEKSSLTEKQVSALRDGGFSDEDIAEM